MGRPKSRWGASSVILLLTLSYLCFFVIPIIFSLLTAPLAFVLARAPFFALAFVLALVPTIACRALFVEEVPEKHLGVLVNQSDTFKALLPPGKYFLMPGKERIKNLLSLEPASVQMPVLGLQASDGEITPPVIIFSWRIQNTIIQALSGPHQQQVQGLIAGGHRALEQETRGYLQAALRHCVARYSVSALQTLLADSVTHRFEHEVQRKANTLLNPLGLEIDQIELINVVKAQSAAPTRDKASTAASAAQQILAEAYTKLDLLLRAHVLDEMPRRVAEDAWNAYETLIKLRKNARSLSAAIQAYTTLLFDALDASAKQQQGAPDQQVISQARQKTNEELNALQATIGELGKLLIEVELQAKQIKAPAASLTPDEIEQVLEVLRAIEQKALMLEQAAP